ncbi:hypothetical protein P775_27850 [Puniceibacterium antarcticum]|uniref:Uncharacterized protein n=1 Tax=Puniceibacterium antarcticum TaxID=1206336 RepID=A0A2G8QX61_9RHOB|nr:hypothetical protein P775_27850 [Puniceibacterium antarcticum]
MLKTVSGSQIKNLWDATHADTLSESDKLLYRSNRLGSDKRVTNYGGGSGTIDKAEFATLYMNKLTALKGLYRGVAFEDEMVAYLPHCTFALNPRAALIYTPLHAYVPKACGSHSL